jgi:formylglycine-generating enzyme required for sulfatase activity
MKRIPWSLLAIFAASIAIAQAPPEGLVLVKGGRFLMGTEWTAADEKPVREVWLSSFFIAKYEVTQREWREVMGSQPSLGFGVGDAYPIYNLNWYEALEYCNRRSMKEGLTPCYAGSGAALSCSFSANGYRLPTEAEWEFAARGGTLSRDYRFSGANDIDPVGWYAGNSGGSTHPVGTKAPNELGLYDMSGNVWEWCWDWYGEYLSRTQSDPKGPASGTDRVNRGSSWDYGGVFGRVTLRIHYRPEYRNRNLGFRVVRRVP